MTDILEQILRVKAAEVAHGRATYPLDTLRQRAAVASPPRGFAQALIQRVQRREPAVIAEIKKASPSRGVLRDPFDPETIAKRYAESGAACLSVLTDRQFFQGAAEYLVAARGACDLPVIRKDFVVDEYQVMEARAMGADAILLIVAALSDEQLTALEACAMALGMDVLVEVHNRAELDRALQLQTPLLGINNRNLRTFETHLQHTIELLPHIPEDKVVVTESGILSPADVAYMRDADVHAFLVGEAFMRASDPGAALRALFFPA